ncbi:hypothetical protein DICPUDRAFT_99423 [Dictyostelium purpureum]|uniref:Peptidase C1A papain C-terminal domain-containing protein n=1 Tax=Dictyostelium purpureum TaxID=5786 RepID=F0ZZ35_DICPU|nr:uncharacterized protein DICPUDRAFT_99423 [Dictyostelium purpureum]EGC30787.1 hypothetical protein DICPUDRAFT_99423 [Dictyostelium purpureum]|eukprot:XP_003292677.1 hypothetical protein DICPUDRAFT_99423 [Dictyostelium purpureum]
MRLYLLLILILCITRYAYAQDFSEKEKTKLIGNFNNVRSTVTPKILGTYNTMSWDSTLYANAFAQAQTCQRISQYSQKGNSGAYGESFLRFNSEPSPNDVVDGLSANKQYYNYDDTFCNGDHDCTPYTNIIWNNTNQAACSKNNCGDNWYVVCNFAPVGSFSGVKPYNARFHDSLSLMSYSNENTLLNLNQRLKVKDSEHIYTVGVNNVGSYDWRDQGVVGYPQDSGNCAAGWAFTAVGVYESRAAMRSKKRYELSEQQVIDCINNVPNPYYQVSNYTRCSRLSGDLNKALIYIQQNGIQNSVTYPYVGDRASACTFNSSNIVVQGGDIEYSDVGRDSIIEKCRDQGPVGVGIYVTDDFLRYSGGIFFCNNTNINNNAINHNVLLVGYNQDNNYYIIKNNFGRSWGENGFARISADYDKDCLISRNPAYSVQI